jgi:large subunit ribosomal protein L6
MEDMPITNKIERKIELPDGVTAKLEGNMLMITGKKHKLAREFFNPRISISTEKKAIILSTDLPTKREKALIGTWRSHIANMVKGVTDGFQAKMKIVYSHFPMKAVVKGEIFIIDNFLGEKHPRSAVILGETKVEVKGDTVILTGPNKEHVGQTAANIEQETMIRGYDPRVFQDGIYIVEKPS